MIYCQTEEQDEVMETHSVTFSAVTQFVLIRSIFHTFILQAAGEEESEVEEF